MGEEDGAIGTGLDELIDSVEASEPVPHGQSVALAGLIRGLKARRVALGLNLREVAARAGLTRSMVSRLENGWTPNPTLVTLYRYALALNANIRLVAEEIAADEGSTGDD